MMLVWLVMRVLPRPGGSAVRMGCHLAMASLVRRVDAAKSSFARSAVWKWKFRRASTNRGQPDAQSGA